MLYYYLLPLLSLIFTSSGSPIVHRDNADSDPISIFIPDPTTIIVTPTNPPDAFPLIFKENELPIDGTSFFAVSSDCYNAKLTGVGFPNKGAFYEQAYRDAGYIASSTSDWPLRNTDVSDIYFGNGTDASEFASDIQANLAEAAHWDHPRFGFDNYIVLTCGDPFQSCGRKVGADPRTIACYVNNTISWWWNKSFINCCDPFFTVDSISRAFTKHQNDDKSSLDLRYLQTSGSFLLHEMMHTLEITGTKGQRQHLIDETFDNSLERRIYGPEDVAKAARIEGYKKTHLNADSYAQFASAIYWKKRLGGFPWPKGKGPTSADDFPQLITDNDFNYVVPVLPDPPVVATPAPSFVTDTYMPSETGMRRR